MNEEDKKWKKRSTGCVSRIAELEVENARLRGLLAAAEKHARDSRQFLLATFRKGGRTIDAVVIPPGGRMSSPVSIDETDLVTIEMTTSVVAR